MKKLFILFLLIVPITFFASDFIIGDPLPDAPELAYRGDYQVGVRTLYVSDPGRIDILNYSKENPEPIYDRPLTLEVWYPAIIPENKNELTNYDDPNYVDESIIHMGRALRNAEPVDGKFPLIILSHGYPGTRFMMSYLTENLTSKGYVVIAIDHTDSTVIDQNQFYSTLLNRSLDILFTLDKTEELSKNENSFLYNLVDTDNVGLAGYSMGGYGIINVAGAGYTEASANYSWGVPGGYLSMRQSGNPEYEETIDPRIKAIFAMSPWGAAYFWNEETMKGLETPSFFVVGEYDDVAGYENGVKLFFDWAINSESYLLTVENARHNVAPNAYGPNPLPSFKMTSDDFLRYNEPAWDNKRLNNIVQHFATAFFGIYLKSMPYDNYLDLIESSNEGVWDQDDNGEFTEEHTHWAGFPYRTALGLQFRKREITE